MNLQTTIKNFKGEELPMSFPTKIDLDKVKDEKKIEVVMLDDLPRETVYNTIINCLTKYKITADKEIFEVQAIAAWVLDENPEKEDLSPKLKELLVKSILPQCTLKEEKQVEGQAKKQPSGMYPSWQIAQVYKELGVEK